MALTMLEAAKAFTGDDIRQAIIEIFVEASDLMRALPFETIAGNSLKYDQEGTLPGIAFRGVNEAYSEGTGVINPQVENLVIAGGDLDVDKFILRTMGEGRRSTQVAMKTKALSHTISHKIIKGDSETDQKEFDGLQKRLTGNQLIANGASASGGNFLSLGSLDAAMDAVDGATHLFMSKAMRRTLTAAARLQTVGGHVSFDKDEFGRQITIYNGLPILIADGNGDVNATLGFNEANPGGGGAVGTSIYTLSLSDDMLTGIQEGPMMVTDIGELQTKPVMRTRIEWYPGLALWHPRAASRLYGIKAGAAAV
jgi:hypothetical protein